MLRTLKSLFACKIHAMDGDIGGVRDFYFDDKKWGLRYLVADTGNWLTGKRVLVSPTAIQETDLENRRILVNLTKEQIEKSPSVMEDRPVTRQMEQALSAYYAWPAYWEPLGLTQPAMVNPQAVADSAVKAAEENHDHGDPHLQSVKDVTGYHIHAEDGEIGHIVDFLADDETWAIHYIEADTRNWWPGRKVLIAPEWVESLAWELSEARVGLLRETIRNAPAYDPEKPIDAEFERMLRNYYIQQKQLEMEEVNV